MLFPPSGDLGTTAKEVEEALETSFSLANRWDCILLLDEADVFLAQRTKEDFKRNGLVAGQLSATPLFQQWPVRADPPLPSLAARYGVLRRDSLPND